MNIDNPQKSLSGRIIALTFLCLCMAACTHGPEERRAVIEQVVRPGDSYTAYALVQSEVFRKPTGINTFPNGGVNWILSQKVKVYEVHARDRNVRLLAELPADDATWQSFSGHITGFDDQNNLYLQLSGCEKGGECYPELHNYRYFHLNAEGTLEPLSELPPNAGLPGIMLARRQGEVNYVRFSISRDTLKAKFQEDGGYESLFITDKKGNLSPYTIQQHD